MITNVKYLILGAGPAGLSFAHCLKNSGVDSFLVLEKESVPGGLCRSEEVDGSPFDIGGGHFLDVRRPKVNELLFCFMPEEEWDLYERNSKIALHGTFVDHPLEGNIWQLDETWQEKYLASISRAGCNTGTQMPPKFVEWIRWKLGDRIAEDYMLPYNRKMFQDALDEIGTYWLNKLPDVSYEDTLNSCRDKRPYGKQPGHAQFYYPKKYGYGEVWLRMGRELGDRLLCNCAVTHMNVFEKTVQTQNGDVIRAERIITTVPWNSFSDLLGLSEDLLHEIGTLCSSSVETRYFDRNLDTKAHWIYEPSEEIPYHRILVRHNFCPGSKGFWTETRKERTGFFGKETELKAFYLTGNEKITENQFTYMNEYAYPINTVNKPQIMEKLRKEIVAHGVFGLGRWGEHEHYNSDATVERAMNLAKELV